MKQTQFDKVIILSAELSSLSEAENEKRSSNLKKCLSECKLAFNEAKGYYKGSEEISFVVLPKNPEEVKVLKDFAFKSFGQESILYRDYSGDAYLHNNDDSIRFIGQLQNVPSKYIESLDSYTILNGEVYTTEVI